jgi:ABC-2 type transport system ATP-binding protein
VTTTTAGEPIIAVRGLTKRFGDFTAVDDLTIEVAPGTIYAFLGANGSGKSTTIRMLIGLLTPTAGTVRVDGVDVVATPRRVRDRIGYMGQRVSLYQGLSVRENVEFYAGLHGLAGEALETRWGELRERFALASAEGERPENLPAGIRQRAGLALAMLHRPRVLFLDEPTAGVDVDSRGLFWDVIQDEAGGGATIFVTTHFLEEVNYCDWVSFIDRGRLIANDTPDALRLRYGGGYRVRVRPAEGGGDAARESLAATLRAAGLEVTPVGDALDVRGDGRIDPLRRRLVAALGDAPARIEVGMPLMTDVFREVIRENDAKTAAKEAA